ncbi:nucleotide sugar dehydrogenase [Brochothrix campestris]|uniref:nucleotide sugar dehydrogenase n=1 Tax=Brochothrix campestris TaxID=2757 RepID=UPI0038D017B5
MKIVTMGLGYIGLPTAVMFANHNQDVVGVDVNCLTVEQLNRGILHIEEPGLQEELNHALACGTFKASLTPEKADVFIIAVPTPNHNDDLKSCDLSYVANAIKSILPFVEVGNTIILESTVAPQSTENLVQPMLEEAGFIIGETIYLVHCPERVLPGQIIHELVYNNRIIGGVTAECTQAGKEVYETFVKGELILTTARTAELSKLMENTFRDVNIALANELVKISADLDIDALKVIEMANKHPRVNLHQPGPGVGGHCLAIDPYFIAAASPDYSPLIQLSREINTSMPQFVITKTNQLMQQYSGKKITVFGLTYKGDIDDVRESPAMEIYEHLTAQQCFEVVAYDPHVEAAFVEKNLAVAINNADLILVLTDHSAFREMDSTTFENMNQKNILDTKNILNVSANDINYINLGNLARIEKVIEQTTQLA